MKKRFNTLTLVIACVLCVALTVFGVAGYAAFRYGGAEGLGHALKFATVYHTIENYFVGEADMEFVSDAAFDAMVRATGDPWSYYMNAEQLESYLQYQSNAYAGIGVTIAPDETSGYLRVVSVFEDSPAQLAQVKIGDLMLEIDGVDLHGMTASAVKAVIAEKQGADFSLKLRTQDEAEKTVNISAATVSIMPVEYELLEGDVGYIRIKNFEQDSGEQTIAAIKALTEQGAKGLVFDVRNNPGGLLDELLEALDYILPEGEVFVAQDKAGKEAVISSDAACVELPMAVLINEDSYSAAEFFAAALSDFDWGTVVGSRSTGKSRSQVNIMLSDGSAVHLSTRSYLTPGRTDLTETEGLVPDIEVALTETEALKLYAGELPHDEDPQLKRAAEKINPGGRG